MTWAIEPFATSDVVDGSVDCDEYPAVGAGAVVLFEFLASEIAAQFGQARHLLHRRGALCFALDDFVNKQRNDADEREVHRASDDLVDEAREEWRLRFVVTFIGHLRNGFPGHTLNAA